MILACTQILVPAVFLATNVGFLFLLTAPLFWYGNGMLTFLRLLSLELCTGRFVSSEWLLVFVFECDVHRHCLMSA